MSELTPYLAVGDARAAIRWYVDVFGAVVTFDPIVMPDGRIGHVELAIDGARLMMADAHPEIRSPAPVPDAGSPVTLHLSVADVDALVSTARAAGAVVYATSGAYPTTFLDMTTGSSPVLTAGDGATVTADAIIGKGWQLTMNGGGTSAPTFSCALRPDER